MKLLKSLEFMCGLAYLRRMLDLHHMTMAETPNTPGLSWPTQPSRVAVAVKAALGAGDSGGATSRALCGRAHFAAATGQRAQLLQQLRTLGVLR